MSANPNAANLDVTDVTSEPEESLAGVACDPNFSAMEFDRDHGAEVEAARRELAAQGDGFPSAA